MVDNQDTQLSAGRRSLLEALLPRWTQRAQPSTPPPPQPQPSAGEPEHELKVTPSGAPGSARVVLWHRSAQGDVHEATFQLGDARKRKQFADAALSVLGGKLTSDGKEKLRKDIEDALLWHKQQLQAKKEWQESEAARLPVEKLQEKERRAGRAVLKSSSLLYGVAKALEWLGLAGETNNALLLYLAITSRLGDKILSVVGKAESSSGKSFLVETVLKLFPPEAYITVSGLSPQALYYDTEDYRHRMLIVAEADGIKEAGEYSLRTLLTENKLKLKTVGKDAQGSNEGQTLEKEGPTGLIMTTTRARMNPENETRYLSIGLDESPAQTQRIKKATAKRWASLRSPRSARAASLDVWTNLQRMLVPVEVMVPFSEFLADRTPREPLRMRRDFEKLLLLISASAILHQAQRRKLGTTEDGKPIIEAGVLDYFIVKELFEKLFFQSLHGISLNALKVMEAIKKLHQEKFVEAQPNPTTGFVEDVTVTTQELVKELGKSKTTVLGWAKPLEPYGWIAVAGGEGVATEFQPGIEPKKSVLPSIDELLSRHPELLPAGGLEAHHPLTGERVKLGVPRAKATRVQGSNAGQSPEGALVCQF
jgi:hypothetical protein